MINKITIFFLLTILVSCASSSNISSKNSEEILNRAESSASPNGKKILEAASSMISNQEIIVGGCWDYINNVYDRVGFSTKDRITVFKSQFKGPYAKTESIQPGDWLYFGNHTYRDSEHSAIFVEWINEAKKEALMISYVGEKKKKPAGYKKFVLNNIYNIVRPRD